MASSMNGLTSSSMNGPSSSSLHHPHHCSSTLTTASGESLVGINPSNSTACLKETEVLKSQLTTREGVYRSMTGSEFRPNRLNMSYTTTGGSSGLTSTGMTSTGIGSNSSSHSSTPVKVSFISMKDPLGLPIDRICFNVGRELFVYNYRGVKKPPTDHSKPIDKRIYKGTFPTCHDFNLASVSVDSVHLLIGFSAGQIQLIDPIKKEFNKLYNEERLIDKSKVTCIKWVPNSLNVFLVSHSSGQLYVYKEDLPCGSTPPHYQLFKSGEGFSVHTCRAKSTRNPLYRWIIGEGSLNDFAFSPCGKFLATVSQDGFMRVFEYDTMELVGRMRSYFGGLVCLSWSPDGKLIVTGGEDDLITVWSVNDKRVVARGQGHRSWVSVVAFDPYTTSTSFDASSESTTMTGNNKAMSDGRTNFTTSSEDDEDNSEKVIPPQHTTLSSNNSSSYHHPNRQVSDGVTCYRIGSVAQDTLLCLWELNDDVLRQPVGRSRASILIHSPSNQLQREATGSFSQQVTNATTNTSSSTNNKSDKQWNQDLINTDASSTSNLLISGKNNNEQLSSIEDRQVSKKKEHKRSFSLGSRSTDKNHTNKKESLSSKLVDDPVKLLGSPCCPRLEDVPILEPLVCKKISHERLTALVFREDCFVAACQEGYVSTWARPGHGASNSQLLCSPSAADSDDHVMIDADDDDDDDTIV